MKACLNYFRRKPNVDDGKQQRLSSPLVPPVFEEDTSNVSSSTSREVNRTSRIFLRKKDKDPLPPVVTEVSTLLCEAESEKKKDFAKSLELLEKATTLGSACAAAKLAVVYHGGHEGNSSINPDYASASAYYLLALKLIYMIPCEKWDMSMLLEVIAGLSEIYRKQMSRKRDNDIWNTGIRAMFHIDSTLKDPSTTKHLEHEEYRKCKAIRIHINYCLAWTAELDNDLTEAVNSYEVCRRIGECNFATADKLVKKSQDNAKMLERRIPKVKPICVSCDYKPESKKDIWRLLVCPKCQSAAACGRDCLTKHLTTHHAHHATDETTRRNQQ